MLSRYARQTRRLSLDLWRQAQPTFDVQGDTGITAEHIDRHCTQVPNTRCIANSSASTQLQQSPQVDREAEVRRLIYRAKQRGFLELDLLIGSWAEKRVPSMGQAEFEAFQEVLEQENPDVFKWITGQVPAPSVMLDNRVFQELQSDVQRQLDRRRPEDTAAKPGRTWVRGWDDAWRETSSESDLVPDTGASTRT